MISGYIDREIVKQSLFLNTEEWDGYLDLLIAAAGEAISRFTGRNFYSTPIEEVRHFDGSGTSILRIDDAFLVSIISLDLYGSGDYPVSLTEGPDFDLNPLNSNPKTSVKLRPNGVVPKFPQGARSVRITAFWGWPVVPDVVKQATLLTASRWFKRRDAAYNDTPVGESGALDSDVAGMVEPLRSRRNSAIKVLYP